MLDELTSYLARCEALIFDCDGVLVNSEEIAQQVELSTLARMGIDFPRDEYVRRFSGTSEEEYRRLLCCDVKILHGLELTHEFFDAVDAGIHMAYSKRLAPIDGAKELVSAWGKPKAVASSSSMRTLQYKLKATGLDTVFGQHIYSADAVRAGKPDPAVFLLAAECLDIPPARCIVIEDSVNGIVAAKRADMTAFGFVGGGHCLSDHALQLRDVGADLVFESHQELASLLTSGA